jgi:hypothetical protein
MLIRALDNLLTIIALAAAIAIGVASFSYSQPIPPRQYTVVVTHSLERLPDGRAQRGLATIVITDGVTNTVVKRFVAAYPTTYSPPEIDKYVKDVVNETMATMPEPRGPLAPDSTFTIIK